MNLFTIILVAFFVSLGLGSLFGQPLSATLLSATIAMIAGYLGATIAERRRIQKERRLRHSLHLQIQELEAQQEEIYQDISVAIATQRQAQSQIQALEYERKTLLDRVSELHIQRNELRRDVAQLFEKRQAKSDTTKGTQNNRDLSKKIVEEETRLNLLKSESLQLNSQVRRYRQQEREIQQKLVHLSRNCQELELGNLLLQRQQETLQRTVLKLKSEQQKLQTEIAAKKTQIETFDRQFKIIDLEEYVAETETDNQETNQLDLPEECQEWLDFIECLELEQKKIFKILLEQDEIALKEIADQQATMPEVLIDSLNELALENLGDTIFTGSNHSIIPEIHQEYAAILNQKIIIYLQDLLKHQDSK